MARKRLADQFVDDTAGGKTSVQDRVKSLEGQIKQKDKLLEQQQRRIDQMAKKGFSFPKSRPKKSGAASFTRVIVTDTHGCFVNRPAFAAMLNDLEILKPSEIILLGDHLDCAGWLSKHHPFKTIQEARYSFDDDQQAANEHLDEIQKRCPRARIHYLEGNHEERIEQFVVEATQAHPKDASYLRGLFSPESILHLEKRKISYYRRTVAHCGLRVNGVLKLDDPCHFVHGVSHAKDAARKHIQILKRCVVYGHTHRREQAGESDVITEMDAWCPGCLCNFEPIWRHGSPTGWSHGYGVQIVSRSPGRFFHINVPVLDGSTDLSTLVK